MTKKLEEVDKCTETLGEIIKESNSGNINNQDIIPVEIDSEDDTIQSNIRALPNKNKFSSNLIETLRALINSESSSKLTQDEFGRASILGVSFITLGGDRVRMNDIYDLTPKIYKALSSTAYSGKTMKEGNDILMKNIIKNGLNYTGVGDKSSKRKKFLPITLPRMVEDIQNRTFEEIIDNSDKLEGQGVKKVIISSNIVDIYTRLEIFLGLILSGHTDTLTQASNLIDEL